MIPQITVLDTGGQYCHLIARRVRELGVYADVQPSDIAAAQLSGRRGAIISGGPSSVYETGSPSTDPRLYEAGFPVLGICYGLQLMARALGGEVALGERGEYGHATLETVDPSGLLADFEPREPVWMSHRDQVRGLPPGFRLTATTETCPVAAIEDRERKLFGVQFHPEVVHTRRGMDLLRRFIFGVCGAERDWDPRQQLPEIERQIRETAAGRNVLFFASGGVDSTVAFALTLRTLGPSRVHAVYVDTGLMREGETEFVRRTFDSLAPGVFEAVDARREFLEALTGVVEPERKRHLIGEEFVRVQERILEQGRFLDGDWILGQGTIYPDTIESGGTAKADLIKTHHNRVAGIQKLIAEKRLVEPLRDLYKDEVRTLGRELGLPTALLDRHPFPGPGLAIRCLGSERDAPIAATDGGWVVSVSTVGVQGDSRTYRAVLAVEQVGADATEIVNRRTDVNRVIELCAAAAPLGEMRVFRSAIDAERLTRLRHADAIVREWSVDSGFEEKVWQFPVVLIPLGVEGRPDSLVLRPIHSVDGMTASVVEMGEADRERLSQKLLAVPGVAAVFYDRTNKPPATIEWE
ncbi:MAG: glutamine-hydrolyzing GMP synthase [Bryobacteraceae bacterium]|nr:glutamine-hydrolyzing GMP synthase [Bryobacteraceae bacterium]